MLAGAIAIRDRPPSISIPFLEIEASHGTALDRVGAFQQGLTSARQVAGHRHGRHPSATWRHPALCSIPPARVAIWDHPQMLSSTVDVLNQIFTRQPAHNRIRTVVRYRAGGVLPRNQHHRRRRGALAQIGTPADESQRVLLQGRQLRHLGGDIALCACPSNSNRGTDRRRDRGDANRLPHRSRPEPDGRPSASNNQLVLSAGDLDEAVSGLLTNGIVASDVNAMTVPSGFTRILAFRSGLAGDLERCYERFPDQ